MLDGSAPISISDSLAMSGMGILVVFMELVLLACLILVISKIIRAVTGKKSDPAANAQSPTAAATPKAAAPAAAPAPATPVAAAPQYVVAPPLTLCDVDEPTAATAMAVVSHQTGIPLNRLAFHSIRGCIAMDGVAERDAAVIMALVAHKMNKPLNKLCFKSIRCIGDAPTEQPKSAKETAEKKPAAKKPAAKKTAPKAAKTSN